ncbi:MAG: hypothetical protein QG671_2154 [Actinomycetota bacterium]|nr:hypothetical protein [Actinomycetota bacterium]
MGSTPRSNASQACAGVRELFVGCPFPAWRSYRDPIAGQLRPRQAVTAPAAAARSPPAAVTSHHHVVVTATGSTPSSAAPAAVAWEVAVHPNRLAAPVATRPAITTSKAQLIRPIERVAATPATPATIRTPAPATSGRRLRPVSVATTSGSPEPPACTVAQTRPIDTSTVAPATPVATSAHPYCRAGVTRAAASCSRPRWPAARPAPCGSTPRVRSADPSQRRCPLRPAHARVRLAGQRS